MTDLFLDALNGKNTQRPPVWLMRQAGRYMPEYRQLRAKHSFLEMCHQPELIAEVTALPINVFGFDAAILFSDILLILEALKLGLHFDEGVGPIIDRPVRSAVDIANLPSPDIRGELGFVAEGIRNIKREVKVPLIGFAGAPFTVAAYAIEGKSVQNVKLTKQWMLRDPASFHQLLDRLCGLTIQYLQMQIDAGVDAIQIFDTWAGLLSYHQFEQFVLPYLKKIVVALKPNKKPIILFCRGSASFFPLLLSASPDAIGVDWQCDLALLRKGLPKQIAIQGNLDPDLLYADKTTIKREVNRLLDSMQNDPGYVFNLGHGIHPDTPVESVSTLLDCVQQR